MSNPFGPDIFQAFVRLIPLDCEPFGMDLEGHCLMELLHENRLAVPTRELLALLQYNQYH